MPLKWAGARTDPATSDPMPILPPPYASKAASPPVEPPGEYLELWGFVHRPHTSFVDSKERRVIGRAVFTYGTAPGVVSASEGDHDGVRILTCIFQNLDHCPVFRIRLSSIT